MSSILHQHWAGTMGPLPPRMASQEEVARPHLTAEQERRLSDEHYSNHHMTPTETRAAYTGPRWPWLCGKGAT